MKRILCYGDSNTWGSSGDDTRIDDAKQWPNILQQLLGQKYHIIQEGLGGRTAGNLEKEKPRYNGQASFEVVYYSSSPVDLVIIGLGTNDFKKRYGHTAKDIRDDLLWYQGAVVDMARLSEGKETRLLYICPANFTSNEGYFEASPQVRNQLIELMRQFNAPVIELEDLEMASDGLHYSESAHQEVASTVKQKLEEMNI